MILIRKLNEVVVQPKGKPVRPKFMANEVRVLPKMIDSRCMFVERVTVRLVIPESTLKS